MRSDGAAHAILWLRDLTRDVESRLTEPTQSSNSPLWSPDGTRIAFSISRHDLYLKDASGGNEEPLVQTANHKAPSDWSPDGRFLLYTEIDPETEGDIWILSDPLNKSGGRRATPFLRTRFDESQAQFSPDGRWIAYTSNESGTYQVYIRPFPTPPSGSDVKWQVSLNGAWQPRWNHDGKELFYLNYARTECRAPDLMRCD
jgi:Tol biopolymer transport system component